MFKFSFSSVQHSNQKIHGRLLLLNSNGFKPKSLFIPLCLFSHLLLSSPFPLNFFLSLSNKTIKCFLCCVVSFCLSLSDVKIGIQSQTTLKHFQDCRLRKHNVLLLTVSQPVTNDYPKPLNGRNKRKKDSQLLNKPLFRNAHLKGKKPAV